MVAGRERRISNCDVRSRPTSLSRYSFSTGDGCDIGGVSTLTWVSVGLDLFRRPRLIIQCITGFQHQTNVSLHVVK